MPLYEFRRATMVLGIARDSNSRCGCSSARSGARTTIARICFAAIAAATRRNRESIRGGALRFASLMLGLALAIASLAQPRWGYTYEDVKRKGLDLLFAVDTSRSMLSNDVQPNRLERVKLAAQDFIDQFKATGSD